jgi:hypothetical protein
MSEAAFLIEQAKRCRRLAEGINDERAVDTLHQMADEFERRAADLAPG